MGTQAQRGLGSSPAIWRPVSRLGASLCVFVHSRRNVIKDIQCIFPVCHEPQNWRLPPVLQHKPDHPRTTAQIPPGQHPPAHLRQNVRLTHQSVRLEKRPGVRVPVQRRSRGRKQHVCLHVVRSERLSRFGSNTERAVTGHLPHFLRCKRTWLTVLLSASCIAVT